MIKRFPAREGNYRPVDAGHYVQVLREAKGLGGRDREPRQMACLAGWMDGRMAGRNGGHTVGVFFIIERGVVCVAASKHREGNDGKWKGEGKGMGRLPPLL